MKTVLSFIDWYLPGYKAGGVLKAFANQVAHLNNEIHFKIITRNTDYMEDTPYENVKSNAWNSIAHNADVYYFSVDQLNYKNLKLLTETTHFDVAYIHGVYSLWFSILPLYLTKKKKCQHIIVAAHGMLGKHALSVKTKKKLTFLRITKLLGLYNRVFFHAANHLEQQDILLTIGKNTKTIIAEELPMKIELDAWQQRTKQSGVLNLCTIARIAPEKNIAYAIEILLKCKVGKITFDIYGPIYNQEYWNQCLNLINQCPENISVNYCGSIPGEEVIAKLKSYHCMFLPTTGENFGHTILESFMAATPVIISNNTPWKNLKEHQVGWDLELNNQQSFVTTIENLSAMDQINYDHLSKSADKYAKAFISENEILAQNIRLFLNP